MFSPCMTRRTAPFHQHIIGLPSPCQPLTGVLLMKLPCDSEVTHGGPRSVAPT